MISFLVYIALRDQSAVTTGKKLWKIFFIVNYTGQGSKPMICQDTIVY